MSVFFDIVRNPELAERVEDSCDAPCDVPPPPATTLPLLPAEIQRLRRRAQEVDNLRFIRGARHPLDDLAQEFLGKCLQEGAAAAETSQRDLPNLVDRRYQFILRVCSVPLITGDWETVVKGRESAIAAAAELHAQGYASPLHRFERTNSEWTLSIRFGF